MCSGGSSIKVEDADPASGVALVGRDGVGAESLPAPVRQLDLGPGLGGGERNLDVGGEAALVGVPSQPEAMRRVPVEDVRPVGFAAVVEALEDAAPGPALEHDGLD